MEKSSVEFIFVSENDSYMFPGYCLDISLSVSIYCTNMAVWISIGVLLILTYYTVITGTERRQMQRFGVTAFMMQSC